MDANAIDLKHLLDINQIEKLLSTMSEQTALAFFVTDTNAEVFIQATPPNSPPDLSPAPDSDARQLQVPIEIRGQQAGQVIGMDVSGDTEPNPHLETHLSLIQEIVAGQAFKEYELKSLSVELMSRYEELTLLYEMTQALGTVFDIPTICDIALETALQVFSVERAYIALMDEKKENLTVVASKGMDGFVGWRIPVGHGITGHVAATGQQVLLDARETNRGDDTQALAKGRKPKPGPPDATLSVPLTLLTSDEFDEKGVLGVLTMAGKPIGERFSAGDAKLLTTLSAQIATAIHNSRSVRILRQAERVQQEIKIAAHIQQSLLPKRSPEMTGISLAARCVSAANVGGDYYDFVTDENGRLTLLIADASGHNVGSALMMVTARTRLRYELERGKSLSNILADTNRAMHDDLSQAEMFITVFCARYDPDTRVLNYVNSGHNPPLLRRTNGQILSLDTDGLILGVLDEVVFEEKAVTLESGDLLVMYTDGVVEAKTPSGIQFGQQRLGKLLTEQGHLPPDELIERIYKSINRYIGDTPQQDDITLLVFKVT